MYITEGSSGILGMNFIPHYTLPRNPYSAHSNTTLFSALRAIAASLAVIAFCSQGSSTTAHTAKAGG